MTAGNRLLILPTKRRIWTWVRDCHSWCTVCSNSFKVWTGGVLSFSRRPIMSQMCSIGLKSGPWKSGYRFVTQVIYFNTSSVWSGVVIHKDSPCIQKMIVKVRHNTCFKDVLPIDLSIEVASYCNEVKLTFIWYTSPYHDWASSERNSFNNVTLSISSVRLSPYAHSAIYHVQQEATFVGPMNLPPRGQIPLTTSLAPLQQESFGCLLVSISLQFFLNDSQQISDDFGLFLQIATDGATTVFSKQ